MAHLSVQIFMRAVIHELERDDHLSFPPIRQGHASLLVLDEPPFSHHVKTDVRTLGMRLDQLNSALPVEGILRVQAFINRTKLFGL